MQEKEIKNTAFLTEIRAGLTTFATMAYIIAVNVSYPAGETALERGYLTSLLKASIVSQTGGTCICNSKTDPTCAKDADYAQCVLGNILLRSP